MTLKKINQDLSLPIEEMKKAEEMIVGSSEVIFKKWVELQDLTNYAEYKEREFENTKLKNNHSYQLACLGAGSFLATLALCLGGFGIFMKTELLPLAALITPIAGLAGVFLWGYQRKD